jgi:predicted PurR-regulated permease PerM
MSTIDLVFVISLSILSLSFLVFLFFFIPVLIQLAKTLEAAQSLVNIARDYMVGFNSKINSIGNSIAKLGSYATDTVTNLGDTLIKLLFRKKK